MQKYLVFIQHDDNILTTTALLYKINIISNRLMHLESSEDDKTDTVTVTLFSNDMSTIFSSDQLILFALIFHSIQLENFDVC